MEPMTLGSPVNAATGYGGVNPSQPQQGGAQYLPGYLMGDVSIQVLQYLSLKAECVNY